MCYFVAISVLSIIFSFSSLVWAQNDVNSSTNISSAAGQSENYALPFVPGQPITSSSPPQPATITCPAINELVRNPSTLKWEGKDPLRWKPYEMSFETSISRFSGAQWHGTKIGQLFCVYHSPVPASFPILVLFHAQVLEPTGLKWSKNLGDYRNCISQNLKDCAFVPAPAPPAENPYQQLQQMKGTNGTSTELGY